MYPWIFILESILRSSVLDVKIFDKALVFPCDPVVAVMHTQWSVLEFPWHHSPSHLPRHHQQTLPTSLQALFSQLPTNSMMGHCCLSVASFRGLAFWQWGLFCRDRSCLCHSYAPGFSPRGVKCCFTEITQGIKNISGSGFTCHRAFSPGSPAWAYVELSLWAQVPTWEVEACVCGW